MQLPQISADVGAVHVTTSSPSHLSLRGCKGLNLGRKHEGGDAILRWVVQQQALKASERPAVKKALHKQRWAPLMQEDSVLPEHSIGPPTVPIVRTGSGVAPGTAWGGSPEGVSARALDADARGTSIASCSRCLLLTIRS